MPVARRRVVIDQSGDYAKTWVWQSGAPGSVSPVDLTGAAARLLVFSVTAPTAPVLSISTVPNAQGSLALGGTLGTVAATIVKAATALLLVGTYSFQLWIDWPGGTSTLFLSGPCIVNAT